MNQAEEFRRQPPTPLAIKPLTLPQPYEVRLPNGLQIILVEDERLPLISYRLAFRTGDAHDPVELPGLSDLMTEMLSEGTNNRTSRQIADEVARSGATLSASCNSDYTIVAASALSKFNDKVLDLMADITLQPSFPEQELDLIKQNTKQGLIAQRGQPSFLASERLAKIVYGDHPYAVISPTQQSIDKISRDELVKSHRDKLVPNNAVFIVVGDFKREAMLKQIESLFGDWTSKEIGTYNFPVPPTRKSRTLYLVDRPGSAQSNIIIANLAIKRNSKDYFPMLVMHTILGGNASARLFMNLREEKGYTYGAYSSLDARREAGTLRATAEVRGDVTGASLKEFFYELDRIREESVSDKELKDAKSYLTGVFPIRLETQEGLTDQLVHTNMYDLPSDYLQTYRDNVSAITKEQVQQIAEQYVTPDKSAIVIVGDSAAIMDQVSPFSNEIQIYDSEGNLKK